MFFPLFDRKSFSNYYSGAVGNPIARGETPGKIQEINKNHIKHRHRVTGGEMEKIMFKFTVDKEFTTVSKVATVKNAYKELKATYNENNILDMFNFITGNNVRGKILETSLSGFNSNSINDDVTFRVEMLIYDTYYRFYHISFYLDYVDGAFGVVERDQHLLVSVRKFD